MYLTTEQQSHLFSLLHLLRSECGKNESIKPALEVFKCGTINIIFEYYWKDKLVMTGDYSEVSEYIDEYIRD